jgi:DNA-binding PadR family transcriptional regulator
VKGDSLGAFEEMTLLAVLALGDQAYGVAVQEHLEQEAGHEVTLGPVYAALDRLERKGLVRSALGDVTPERGGKRKRLYTTTRAGTSALKRAREIREALWRAVDAPGRARS